MTIKSIFSLAILTLMTAAVCADEAAVSTGRHALETARKFVEARNFPEALKLYQRLVKAKPDDSDILIEAARVYGWADRNRESAALYQRVIKQFPARRNDVAQPLAMQLLWSDQAREAIPLFQEALAAVHFGQSRWRDPNHHRISTANETPTLSIAAPDASTYPLFQACEQFQL